MNDEARPQPTTRSISPRLIVAALIGVLLLWFAFANRDPVEINYIFFTRDSRLIYIIIGAAVLGAVAGALVRRSRERRARRARRDRRDRD